MLAALGLFVPAVFAFVAGGAGAITGESHATRSLVEESTLIALLLIAGYVLSLVFQFLNPHESLGAAGVAEHAGPSWSGRVAIAVLLIAAAFLAVLSEILVGSIEPFVKATGLSELFIGVVLIPTIGNLAEHIVSVQLAWKKADDRDGRLLRLEPPGCAVRRARPRPARGPHGPADGPRVHALEIVAVGATVGISALIALDGESNTGKGAPMTGGAILDRSRMGRLMAAEMATFARANPRSKELFERAKASLHDGVPMNWMVRWASPFPPFVETAEGASFGCVDGHDYIDFCLGDTGAMAGHGAAATIEAVERQLRRGITHMLPTEDAIWVGEELQRRFELPYWQFTLSATDANRFALRLARHITGRPKIVVHNYNYHGSVDETFACARRPTADGRRGAATSARPWRPLPRRPASSSSTTSRASSAAARARRRRGRAHGAGPHQRRASCCRTRATTKKSGS